METEDFFFIPTIHPSFCLNQQALNFEDLQREAYCLVKDGEVYEQHAGSFLMEWMNEKDFVMVHTSGSTGNPKKIKIYKRQMIHSAKATGKFFKVQEDTTVLLCLSATYIAGKMMLVRAMILGWRIDLVPPKSNPLDTLYRQYDFCAMVPMQLDNSLNRLHLIKKLIVGGGRVSENLIKFVQGVSTEVFETYGMTETVSHIAAKRLNPKKKEKESKYFMALPNITLSVDDRNCLVIKAPKLADDTITTNDVVVLKTYKKFQLKGRYDNVINSGGIKLNPEEIENKLQLLIRHRFFITGVQDDVLGEKLVLVVEDVYSEKDHKNLIKAIKDLKTLSKYEIPKHIYFLPQFIATKNGKIQRTKTKELMLENN